MQNRKGRALALLIGLGLGVTMGALAAQTGGLVPTEYRPVSVEAGPAPDVAFFATGDTMGKIEPCG
jgi:hypothetical protein